MTLPPALQPTDLHPFNRFDVPTLLAQRAVARRDHVRTGNSNAVFPPHGRASCGSGGL